MWAICLCVWLAYVYLRLLPDRSALKFSGGLLWPIASLWRELETLTLPCAKRFCAGKESKLRLFCGDLGFAVKGKSEEVEHHVTKV